MAASQAFHLLLSFFAVADDISFVVSGEFLKKLFLSEALVVFLFCAETGGNLVVRHNGRVVDAVNLDLIQNLTGVGQCLWHIME